MTGASLEAFPFTGLTDPRPYSSSQLFLKSVMQLKQGLAAMAAEVIVFCPFWYHYEACTFSAKNLTECFAIAAELKKERGKYVQLCKNGDCGSDA